MILARTQSLISVPGKSEIHLSTLNHATGAQTSEEVNAASVRKESRTTDGIKMDGGTVPLK